MRVSDIKELYDVPKFSTLQKKGSIREKKRVLYNFIDEDLVDSFNDEAVDYIYDNLSDIIEKKIQSVIYEKTGQKPLNNGTMIQLKQDLGCFTKGSIVTINSCQRFDEDTFGQGWYCYYIGTYMIYEYEFEVVN